MKPRNRKQDKIFASLKEAIQSGSLPCGSRLPGLKNLEEIFDCSRWTLLQAFNKLEAADLIERRKGSGLYVVYQSAISPPPVNQPKIGSEPNRPESIARHLAELIRNGELKAGYQIPQKKVLARQYGASKRTINEALKILMGSALLHQRGPSIMAGPSIITKPAGSHSITLVGDEFSFRPQQYSRLYREFLAGFEAEISRYGISMNRVFGISAGLYHAKGFGRFAGDSLGSLFAMNANQYLQLAARSRQLRLEIPQEVLDPNLPSVLIGGGVVDASATLYARRIQPLFSATGLDNRRAGREVGQYLLALGHRCVAFVSFSDEQWSLSRFKGLKKALMVVAGNQSGSCHPFGAQASPGSLKKSSGSFGSKRVNRILERAVKDIFGDARESLSVQATRSAMKELTNQMSIEDHHRLLAPAFESALGDRDISVWVCSDPIVALAALDFLESRKGKKSAIPSLISIDDHPNLTVRGVTAYNFQLQQMGYLAAHCFLQDIQIKRNRHGVLDCPGRIVDRGSVGRV